MKILVTIYSDLEAFPPSLNAVLSMAERGAELIVVQRSIGRGCWTFPGNVSVRTVVKRSGEAELSKLPTIQKFADFARFLLGIIMALRRDRPDLLIAYDPIPLLACRIALKLASRRPVFWYHNHDTEARVASRRGSVGWLAGVTEKRTFRDLDIFSLPARERQQYFPLQTLREAPLVIPNYPSLCHYPPPNSSDHGACIKLIYQGSLGRHHGFQKILEWLDRSIDGHQLSLTLLGKIDPEFRAELLEKAAIFGVEDRLEISDFIPLTMLPARLAGFTIGLALHIPVGVTYSTGGTASNKIYEYAACGLPVLLYDTPHYREHLGWRSWVGFCRLDWESFSSAVSCILSKRGAAKVAARYDFETELNYEHVFAETWQTILPRISRNSRAV
jgi:glycosyltransferase involved in cell wall biosynthesis